MPLCLEVVFGNYWRINLLHGKIIRPTILCYWANVQCCQWLNIGKPNICIWSHWSVSLFIGQNFKIKMVSGGRQSSVDSSAFSILQLLKPRVWIPSTTNMLFHYLLNRLNLTLNCWSQQNVENNEIRPRLA